MFGRKAKEKRLEDGGGRAAMAAVLSSKSSHHGSMGAGGSSVGGTDVYRLTVRVELDGAPAFEADVKFEGLGLRQPLEGEQVPVLYDPDDHTNVVLDVHKIHSDNYAKKHPDDKPNPELIEKLKELQARFDRGEMSEGEFRAERAKLMDG